MPANPASWNPCLPIANTMAAQPRADLHVVFRNDALTAGWKRLAEGTIAVTLIDVARWGPWFADASKLISADELARVKRRRIPSDRDALALAYALHRLLLGHVLGRPSEDVPLSRDDFGCPRLAGDVAYTSLSHADGLIAIAVTVAGPIGVDIERPGRATVMPEIARSVCHRSEAADLDALDDPARGAALLALWVRKEALLKAAGVGLVVPMETFAAPEGGELVLPGLFADAVQVRMLDAGDRCVAAVAGPAGMRIECCWLPPRVGGGSEDPCICPADWKGPGTGVSRDAS